MPKRARDNARRRLGVAPAGQTGQALALGLVAVSAAGLMVVMLYNVGQIAMARSRLTQATDAAAYAAALVQARTLNMLAHVQRAQVGHQVALAHLVTLGAWAQFSDAQHGSSRQGNPPGMIIGRFFGPLHRRAYVQSGAMSSLTRTALEDAIKGHGNAAHVTLARAANALVQGLPEVRAAAIEQVLRANLPRASITQTRLALPGGKRAERQSDVQWRISQDDWDRLLTRQPSEHTRDPMVDFIKRVTSPYSFLSKRHRTAYNPWSIHPACPWMLHTLQRRGATWMDDTGRWQAVDTQSFQARRFNRYIGCYYREYAMGWGAMRGAPAKTADAFGQDLPDLSKEAYWRWARRATRWDLKLAENRVAGMRAMMRAWAPAQRGIAPWYDIAAQGAAQATFDLDVRRLASSVGTTDRPDSRFGPVGRFLFEGLGGATLRVRAAGRTYFSTQTRQAPSAFRPQWRARLVPTRESGQAMIELSLAMLMLAAFIAAALSIGTRIQSDIESDHISRWLAFTQWPGPSPGAAGSVTASNALSARAQPGGSKSDLNEMRTAWGYADAGLITAQVSARSTAVARDTGHHEQHRATQLRLSASRRAWQEASAASSRIARVIVGQAGQSDEGWRRPRPSFDWLVPWAKHDIRRRRSRKRGLCGPGGQAMVRRRRNGLSRFSARQCLQRYLQVKIAMAAGLCIVPWVSLAGHCGVASAVVSPAPFDDGTGAALPRAVWNAAQETLGRLTLDVRRALGDRAVSTGESFLWYGIPLAMQPFRIALPEGLSIPAAGRKPSTSAEARTATPARVQQAILFAVSELTVAQPALKNLAIIEDRYHLSGEKGAVHWMAQWTLEDIDVVGTLSAMHIAAPAFSLTVPAWANGPTQLLTHQIWLAPGRWACSSLWRVERELPRLSQHIHQALLRAGWQSISNAPARATPSITDWIKGPCALSLQILHVPERQHVQVWLRSTGPRP